MCDEFTWFKVCILILSLSLALARLIFFTFISSVGDLCVILYLEPLLMDRLWNLPLNLWRLLSGLSLSSEEDFSSMWMSSSFTLSSSNVFIFMEMICGSPLSPILRSVGSCQRWCSVQTTRITTLSLSVRWSHSLKHLSAVRVPPISLSRLSVTDWGGRWAVSCNNHNNTFTPRVAEQIIKFSKL